MNKPEGYDETKSFGEFVNLKPGGYKCIIKKATCGKTQASKEYLKIEFDISEGEFKDFYQNKFDNDVRADKKWSGIWTIFINGYNSGTTNSKFKGLITSIEASNDNFKFDFDEQTLVGKKFGIVFREEEFLGQDGQIHNAIKPFYAISCDKVEEAKIPNKKILSKTVDEDIEIFNDDLPF